MSSPFLLTSTQIDIFILQRSSSPLVGEGHFWINGKSQSNFYASNLTIKLQIKYFTVDDSKGKIQTTTIFHTQQRVKLHIIAVTEKIDFVFWNKKEKTG